MFPVTSFVWQQLGSRFGSKNLRCVHREESYTADRDFPCLKHFCPALELVFYTWTAHAHTRTPRLPRPFGIIGHASEPTH